MDRGLNDANYEAAAASKKKSGILAIGDRTKIFVSTRALKTHDGAFQLTGL